MTTPEGARGSPKEAKQARAPQKTSSALRQRAEALIDEGDEFDDIAAAEPRIAHELRVHRIELELQNEELQASRDELERSRQHFSELYEFAPVGYFSARRDGTIVEANLAAAELFALERAKLPGRWVGDFISTPDLPALVAMLGRVFSPSPPPHNCEVTLAGGRVIADLRVTLDAHADTCRVAMIDVTARRREAALRERLAEFTQLEQTRYLESLGRLAGGVAHEFNNKLTAILGNAELVMEGANLLDPTYGRLLDIQISAQSCERLTRQLLGFARQQMISREVLDVNEVTSGTLPMLRSLLGGRAELACALQPDLWTVHMDPSQVEHILVSLVLHASSALPGHGTVTLETSNVVCDETWHEGNVAFHRGEYVCLIVSDTGAGMDAEQLSHVFEPFFRTLDPSAGLGMPAVYGIVKQNQGYLLVDSIAGRGTEIAVYLPRASDAVAPATSVEREQKVSGTETILLVENDEAILVLCRTTLERLGYTVLSAHSGPEALDVATRHSGPLDLLMTSARTHGLQGRNLADAIAALRPALKTLYTSHDVSDLTFRTSALFKDMKFLRKPFSQSQMSTAVRHALDS